MTARKIKGDWWVDFHWRHERGPRKGVRGRVRRRSPINNKRGAEEYERILRERLMRGEPLDAEAAVAMVLLAGDGGLRKGEIAAIEWDDIDLKARKLTVRRNAWFRRKEEHIDSPKSGRDRSIDLTDRLHDALRTHRHLRGERVLCAPDMTRLTPGVMEGVLNHVSKRAGLRRTGWHVLRHTFCSHLAMTGADATTIQEFAGHSTLTMTLRYMHLAPGHKREAIRRLELAAHRPVKRGHQVGISG